MHLTGAVLLMMVKAPRPGRVKTRLAATLGDAAAARLYGCFAQDMLEAARATGLPALVCFDPPDAGEEIRAWLGAADLAPQQGGDLGARMAGCFGLAFGRGFRRALLVGSDLPDLPGELLTDAAALLDEHPAVVGPTLDGGYGLIGFGRDGYRPEVFDGMPWSTPRVLGMTLERLAALGSPAAVLPPWRDVDDAADLAELRARLAADPDAAPRTWAELQGQAAR